MSNTSKSKKFPSDSPERQRIYKQRYWSKHKARLQAKESSPSELAKRRMWWARSSYRVKTLTAAKEYRKKTRKFIRQAKKKPCVDCNVKYPHYVMDFDHVRGKKIFNVSGQQNRTLAVVEAEVAKCDVVCSNCHRKRTWQRKQGFWGGLGRGGRNSRCGTQSA